MGRPITRHARHSDIQSTSWNEIDSIDRTLLAMLMSSMADDAVGTTSRIMSANCDDVTKQKLLYIVSNPGHYTLGRY